MIILLPNGSIFLIFNYFDKSWTSACIARHRPRFGFSGSPPASLPTKYRDSFAWPRGCFGNACHVQGYLPPPIRHKLACVIMTFVPGRQGGVTPYPAIPVRSTSHKILLAIKYGRGAKHDGCMHGTACLAGPATLQGKISCIS